MIHFKFPVSYGGMEVYDVMPPLESSDETAVLLCRQNVDGYVKVNPEVNGKNDI